jgi:hypothetical protein
VIREIRVSSNLSDPRKSASRQDQTVIHEIRVP